MIIFKKKKKKSRNSVNCSNIFKLALCSDNYSFKNISMILSVYVYFFYTIKQYKKKILFYV